MHSTEDNKGDCQRQASWGVEEKLLLLIFFLDQLK